MRERIELTFHVARRTSRHYDQRARAVRMGTPPTMTRPNKRRSDQIIAVLDEAFAPLMDADPAAFRVKYRKMAADPFAFYRGTACLFYADMTSGRSHWDDDFVDDDSSKIWIHGDLHAENF